MAQATLSGPLDHPLADADRVSQIESTPSNWIHDDSDTCPCGHCDERIRLGDGNYLVVTLTEDLGKYRDKTLYRFCDRACYARWVQDARASGWNGSSSK